jgi:hypothetical protein
MINIKPAAPKLNVYIKTNKENEPIRPVINNIQDCQIPQQEIKQPNKPTTYVYCQKRTRGSRGSQSNIYQ